MNLNTNIESIIIQDASKHNGFCLNRELKFAHSENTKRTLSVCVRNLMRTAYIRGRLLGLNEKPQYIPDSPDCVIIASGSNLGGTIISLPLIQAARNRWPNTNLVVVTNTQHGADIINFTKVSDSCYVFRDGEKNPLFLSELKRIKKDLQLKPAVLIDNFDGKIARTLIGLRIPVRIGNVGRKALSGQLLSWGEIYNISVPLFEGRNWLASYSDLASAFGAKLQGYPTIKIDMTLREQARNFLAGFGLQAGQKAIAVQAGVWKQQGYKQWPNELLAKTCSDLWMRSKIVPVVMGVAGQDDAFIKIKSAMPPDAQIINLIGKTSSSEAAKILSVCSASISNDSGMMHLSAAVGTPTVAIYGMTDPAITWCYGSNVLHRIIQWQGTLPCYGIFSDLIDKCLNRPCLTKISHETVTKVIIELLDL